MSVAKTILLVDDEAELRFMIASYFEFSGYQVLTAGTPEEAEQISIGASLSAIILDVNLPGEGSVKLMEHLKRSHPDAIIFLYTGQHADEDAVKNLLRLGAHRYLPKDGSLEKLLAAVREVCG